MKELTTQVLQNALLHTCQLIIDSEPMLTELDTTIGDGDHGIGMKDGFSELQMVLHQKQYQSLYELTWEAGVTLVKAMGGASGVIFGTMFIGGHEALVAADGSHPDRVDADGLRQFCKLSAQRIAQRGRTKANDRTMLDALLYAVDAMEQSDTDDVVELLRCAWEGACRGVEATKEMVPRLGRAKNFRDRVLGYPDPGAVSTSIIFRGLYESVAGRETTTR